MIPLLSTLLLAGTALAQEAPPPAAVPADPPASTVTAPDDAPAPPDSDETEDLVEDKGVVEILVFGEMEIARRRRAVNNKLRSEGYTEKKKKRDGTAVWRPETPWKPSVEVHNDGFVVMKRSPVRFDSYIKGKSPARWIGCIPPFIVMCVRIGGQVVSKTKLDAQKDRVATSMDSEVDAWTEAVTANAMKNRIEVTLPAAMERTWTTGAPFEGGSPLDTPADRRAALLDFWATRACNPEGLAVRMAVENFLEYQVQSSAHPVLKAEQDAANKRQACGGTLDLAPSTGP